MIYIINFFFLIMIVECTFEIHKCQLLKMSLTRDNIVTRSMQLPTKDKLVRKDELLAICQNRCRGRGGHDDVPKTAYI